MEAINNQKKENTLTTKQILLLPIFMMFVGLTIWAIGFPTATDRLGGSLWLFILMLPVILIAVTRDSRMTNIYFRVYYLVIGLLGATPFIQNLIHYYS